MTSRPLSQQVWELHVALTDAALIDSTLYAMSVRDAAAVREDAENREEELALTSILANASSRLPPALLEHARAVARLVWPSARADEVDACVDAWLLWEPGSDVPPPYGT